MKMKSIAVALTLMTLGPGFAFGQTFDLNTGIPGGSTNAILNSSDWYAAEFAVAAGQTVTSLSAYLTQGAGQPGNTYTWDIYSAAGQFTGSIAGREAPAATATGTFAANGWNTVNVNFTGLSAGDYWAALQVSSSAQTPGLDLPEETSATTGTQPALDFAFAGTNHQYTASTSDPAFGVQVTASAATSAAPEIDPASTGAALTLLAGALAVFRGRRSRLPLS